MAERWMDEHTGGRSKASQDDDNEDETLFSCQIV